VWWYGTVDGFFLAGFLVGTPFHKRAERNAHKKKDKVNGTIPFFDLLLFQQENASHCSIRAAPQ